MMKSRMRRILSYVVQKLRRNSFQEKGYIRQEVSNTSWAKVEPLQSPSTQQQQSEMIKSIPHLWKTSRGPSLYVPRSLHLTCIGSIPLTKPFHLYQGSYNLISLVWTLRQRGFLHLTHQLALALVDDLTKQSCSVEMSPNMQDFGIYCEKSSVTKTRFFSGTTDSMT